MAKQAIEVRRVHTGASLAWFDLGLSLTVLYLLAIAIGLSLDWIASFRPWHLIVCLAILAVTQAGQLAKRIHVRTTEQNENTGYLGWKALRINVALILIVLLAGLCFGWLRNRQPEHDQQLQALSVKLEELNNAMQGDASTTASASR